MLSNPIIEVEGVKYERIPIKTHVIHIKEDFMPVIEKYVIPQVKPGDFIAISEKFITISQGRVIHISAVKPGLLAKFFMLGVKKYKDDIGFAEPHKIQVAIWQTGTLRFIVAMVLGTLTRLIGRHGDFYRIAGNRVSEIDGFNPHAMSPFNEFAMLGPANPPATCQEVEDKFKIPCIIIDGNNINTEVLGMSAKMPVTKEFARLILLDNPMGQNDEMTPVVLIRKIID